MGRRQLGIVCVAFLVGIAAGRLVHWPDAAGLPPDTTLSPSAAIEEFKQGNQRFVASRRVRSTDTAHDRQWRQRLAGEQHPIAAVLCCADSRVCPELIFDQGLGRIFEIRNAGNVVDEDVLASVEYAVEHLHVPLILVLGHKGCGAIEAVHAAGGEPLHDHLHALQDHMPDLMSEVLRTRGQSTPELLNRLSAENARQQARRLLDESAVIAEAVDSGQVQLVAGLYDMLDGTFSLWQIDGQKHREALLDQLPGLRRQAAIAPSRTDI